MAKAPMHPKPRAAKALTPKQARFVELYIISLNASGAYYEAYGCTEKVANANGPRLLVNASVSAAIARGQAARSERTNITADQVLRRLWLIASAETREIVEYRRTCCRYCHGAGFQYQRTPAERARLFAEWEARQPRNSTATFDECGGLGFDGKRPPHPECPECFGEGIERPFFHDSRRFSPAAAALYAGTKTTKDGIEAKLHDQLSALEKVGRHLGMFEPPKEPAATEDERIARLRAALAAMDAVTASAA